jgi:DNA adenine methylase
MRDQSPYFRGVLERTSYSEESFRWATTGITNWGDEELPVSYLVRSRMSRGGLGKTFAWSERLRGGQPGDVNAWDTFRKIELPAICERIRGVDFRAGDALALLDDWLFDGDTLVYADPPYVHSTRKARDAYEHEMDDTAHRALLDILAGLPAKVMLSGYRCDIYDDALADWRRVDFDMPNHSGQGETKQRRTESLWLNF